MCMYIYIYIYIYIRSLTESDVKFLDTWDLAWDEWEVPTAARNSCRMTP